MLGTFLQDPIPPAGLLKQDQVSGMAAQATKAQPSLLASSTLGAGVWVTAAELALAFLPALFPGLG